MGFPLSRKIASILLGLALLTPLGCKSTDDYLADLNQLDPAPVSGRDFLQSRAIVFDGGQLAHEAFAGLATTESMQFWQALTGLSHACKFLGSARDKPLLQGDAAILIGHLLSRMPIPPVTGELIALEGNEEKIVQQLESMLKSRKAMQWDGLIQALDSPDESQKIEAHQRLKEETGQTFGPDEEPWRAWYEEGNEERVQQFVQECREPIRFLGSIRWVKASEVQPILRFLAIWVQEYARPELEDVWLPAVMSVARQAAVLSLHEAMIKNRDPIVRADVAQAMATVMDPMFGESLVSQLPLERNSYAAAKMIRALKSYPGRKTIENIITTMAKEDPLVSQNAIEVLRAMTGQDLPRDLASWESWWLESGEKLWP